MKRFRYVLIIPILALLSVSCVKYDQRLEIKDLQKPRVINLHKKPNQGTICSMGIRVSGMVNGEAQITLMLNETPYKTTKMNGTVNFTWGGDWYSNSMELHYQPLKVDSGSLTIEYHFGEIEHS